MTLLLFLIAFVSFFFLALNFLPTANPLPPAFSDGFSSIIGFMKAWDFLFPITEMLILFSFIVSVEFSLWFFRWIWRLIVLIRGSNSS